MADESTFRALLTGFAPLVALVPASRIYDQSAPPDATQPLSYPVIYLNTISATPELFLAEAPDIDNYRIQVDIVAESKAVIKSVLTQVRAALDGHADELDSSDIPTQDPALRRMTIDFSYWANR